MPLAAAALALFGCAGGDGVALFLAVQRLTGHLPDAFWSCVTILGHGSVIFALLALCWRSHPEWITAALIAAPLDGLYTRVIKSLTHVVRPAGFLGDQIHVVGQRLTAGSFPSGHSVAAFSVAALVAVAPRTTAPVRLVVLGLAVLVGISRIAVGAHMPIDVAAGALGGWVCGLAAAALAQHYRLAERAVFNRVLAVVVVAVALDLAFLDLGYPLARPFQDGIAVLGILGALRIALTGL